MASECHCCFQLVLQVARENTDSTLNPSPRKRLIGPRPHCPASPIPSSPRPVQWTREPMAMTCKTDPILGPAGLKRAPGRDDFAPCFWCRRRRRIVGDNCREFLSFSETPISHIVAIANAMRDLHTPAGSREASSFADRDRSI